MSNPINVKLNTGHIVTMKPLVASTGNEWFSATSKGKALSSYGVTVAELGGKALTTLPTSVDVFGRTLRLKSGKSAGGYPKVEVSEEITVDDKTKVFKFAMSDLGTDADGNRIFNLTACKVHGKGGTKKGTRRIATLD